MEDGGTPHANNIPIGWIFTQHDAESCGDVSCKNSKNSIKSSFSITIVEIHISSDSFKRLPIQNTIYHSNLCKKSLTVNQAYNQCLKISNYQ